ncbi:YqaJ viral recombinase family protein [Bacillus sp. Gen3]|nr:YqaJ viral recombinase family protein [Bacillus sp. Gen3]
MKVVVNTKNLPRDQWLEYRRKGIGGSDAGVIAGMSKYKSPFTLYLEKIGGLQDNEQSESAYWGNTLEEVVAAEFSKRAGLEVRERHELLQHDTYDFMLANLDREVICPNRGIGILECKTADKYFLDEWVADKVPDTYYIQVQHYLAITSYTFAYIAVLIGGNTFVYKDIERDEEVINYLITIEKKFWEEHILKKIPPEIDGMNSTKDSLHEIYSESLEKSKELTLKGFHTLKKLEKVKSEIKELETEKTRLENIIKKELGNDQVGTYEGTEIVTWKPTKKGNRLLKIKNLGAVVNG